WAWSAGRRVSTPSDRSQRGQARWAEHAHPKAHVARAAKWRPLIRTRELWRQQLLCAWLAPPYGVLVGLHGKYAMSFRGEPHLPIGPCVVGHSSLIVSSMASAIA